VFYLQFSKKQLPDISSIISEKELQNEIQNFTHKYFAKDGNTINLSDYYHLFSYCLCHSEHSEESSAAEMSAR
jgi:hypothetical protein